VQNVFVRRRPFQLTSVGFEKKKLTSVGVVSKSELLASGQPAMTHARASPILTTHLVVVVGGGKKISTTTRPAGFRVRLRWWLNPALRSWGAPAPVCGLGSRRSPARRSQKQHRSQAPQKREFPSFLLSPAGGSARALAWARWNHLPSWSLTHRRYGSTRSQGAWP
jgi:hypothetical protein